MFKYNSQLYTDVRIEKSFSTNIRFRQKEMENFLEREENGVFIRIYNGSKWYYSSFTDIKKIQQEIDILSDLALKEKRENDLLEEVFEINTGDQRLFFKEKVSDIKSSKKINLLKSYFPLLNQEPLLKTFTATYLDKYIEKEFVSSLGTRLKHDFQYAGVIFGMNFSNDNDVFQEKFSFASDDFKRLNTLTSKLAKQIKDSVNFLNNAKPIEPGKYTVVLSPSAAGVFAHESFGHKSESDFMIGDDTMAKEWKIGKKVGADILSIVDDGNERGMGFCPYDDEGTSARKTYLIKDGYLSGRLHSCLTAALLGESGTGNARALNFQFEPIVRMTTTYIEAGDMTKEELFKSVKEGIYVQSIKHGSGLSTFTLAPSLAWYIKDGKISHPVKVSVVSGNVFETLSKVEALSDEVELLSFAGGGCGKMEQYPLPVGFGGPYVKVSELMVQ
ncbi:MAG: TldD/PmbA family protein [Candidatus Muiribacterium halophilum]|uniref:TldD/PmbA family protein n=1 Tax=Muiribacterium halophilum TaxID=2053465 RepID=A0A2N5ZDM2_MUIH1|nr:MAG: TldD/PmbA family protein [Candidatus Muirbacterium halophilum]